jgi:hypothetical protein
MTRITALLALVVVGCGGGDFRTAALFHDSDAKAFDAGTDTGTDRVRVDVHRGVAGHVGDTSATGGAAGGPGARDSGSDPSPTEDGGTDAAGGSSSASGGTPGSGGAGAGGSRSTGGVTAAGGSSSTGGSSAGGSSAGGTVGAGGAPSTCPANPRSECGSFCGDVTSRCCVIVAGAAHCGCLTDTAAGRVCL